MLRTLNIRDFVIVDRMDLEFDAGFHGADRGNRRRQIDPDRRAGDGARRARRRRRWCGRARRKPKSAPNSTSTRIEPLQRWLAENDLAGDEDACLVRRVIDSGGRSRALHQRPRRDAGAIARGGRTSGRYSRPARAPVAAACRRRSASLLDAYAGTGRRRPTDGRGAWRGWQEHARSSSPRSKPTPRRSRPSASSSNGRCANSRRSNFSAEEWQELHRRARAPRACRRA